jgi:hypothetical protein
LSDGVLVTVSRAIALFLGGFTLLNLAGDLRGTAFDANIWWIDLPGLPRGLSAFILAAFAVAMIVWSFVPRRWLINIALLFVVLLFAIVNTIRYYLVLGRGEIRTSLPIPLSLVIAAVVALLLVAQFREALRASRVRGRGHRLSAGAGGALRRH